MSSTVKKPLCVLMVTGVYPTERIPHSGTFIKTQVASLTAAGLEVEVIHPKPGPVPIRYFSAAAQVFLKTFTKHYDIVNGHYGLWCLAGRMHWKTPVVASFLGGDVFGELYTDGGSPRKADLVVSMCRWISRHVDAVIVKSANMKKALAGQVENIYIIPNGVDFELFRPIPRAEARAALGWDQDHLYVLFGNNPALPAKNYSLAQAAVERLRDRGVFAELVVANGLPQTRVVYYLNACNVLLLPSIYEGSPNVVKEAMACNVPVVATDVGDVSEVIANTKGCKVCAGDAEALAAGLEEAIRHTERTTGRIDIIHLNSAAIAQRVIEVYEQVLSKKAKGREGSSSSLQTRLR